MFRDLSNDDKEEMEQRGAEMIDAIEKKVVAEREAAAEEHAAEAASVAGEPAPSPDDDTLSEEEVRKGATIGRVEMPSLARCVASRERSCTTRMTTPDLSSLSAIGTRELEPVLRRGAIRVIERGSDGFWRIKSN